MIANNFFEHLTAKKYAAVEAGHKHPEAFCLMHYACRDCNHREVIWNSRDGVTPFSMQCPSCGSQNLLHVFWHLDQYAPNHKPNLGQKIWIDMTWEKAIKYATKRVDSNKKKSSKDQQYIEQIADHIYMSGKAPDLVVFGYESKDEVPA